MRNGATPGRSPSTSGFSRFSRSGVTAFNTIIDIDTNDPPSSENEPEDMDILDSDDSDMDKTYQPKKVRLLINSWFKYNFI